LIIRRFGDTWHSAFVLSDVKSQDDFAVSRPAVLTQVGGASGAFDHWSDDNFPLAPATPGKQLSLTADLYRSISDNLEDLKTATVGAGRSKLWREYRDGLTRQWAWAKCTDLSFRDVAGDEYMFKPATLRFSLPEALWYGEVAHTISDFSLVGQGNPYLFNIANFGNTPAMLYAFITNDPGGDYLGMIQFTNSTNGYAWRLEFAPEVAPKAILVDSGAYSCRYGNTYDPLTLAQDGYAVLSDSTDTLMLPWMQLEPGVNEMEFEYDMVHPELPVGGVPVVNFRWYDTYL
jgi:hypothetical protein